MLGITLLAGCRDENETVTKVVTGNSTLKVLIESDSRPRTAVGEDGQLTWVDNDRIGVYGTRTSNVPFAYNGLDEDSTAACFTGDLKPDEIPVRVYYPYQSGASIEGNRLTLELPSEMAYTENSNAPMIGVKQEDGSFLFRHLCGLMKVQVKGVPVGTSRFTITSVGENAPGIAGVATVADITTTDAVLALDDAAATQITVTLSSDEITDKTFYIPLPVGTYPQLSVSFENDDNVLFTKTVSDCEVKRGVMIEMPMAVATSELSVVKGYLETINEHISSMTEERTYEEFVTNLVDWIGEQSYIESVEKEENVISFTFTNGMDSFIAFEIKEEYFGDDVASVQSRSVSYDEYFEFIEKETMFQVADTNPNPESRIVPMKDENEGYKVLCYTPLKWKPISIWWSFLPDKCSYEHELFKKIVDESPIKLKYTLETNGTLKAIKEQFPKNDVILITETHGETIYKYDILRSMFALPDDGSLGKDEAMVWTKNDTLVWRYGEIIYYPKSDYSDAHAKIEKQNYIFISNRNIRQFIDNKQTLSAMYCDSYYLGEYSNARHWIGTSNKSLRNYNYLIIGDYYTALFNGLTYKEASDHCCPESKPIHVLSEDGIYSEDGIFKDWNTQTQFKTSDDSNNELSKERYFSISTDDVEVCDDETSVYTFSVTGKVNGYKNLKSDIPFYIYYREGDEKFEKPLEAEGVIKRGITRLGKNYLVSDGFSNGIDVEGNIKYTLTETYDGLKPNTTYSCALGFEYKGKCYYGEVKTFTTGGDPDREVLTALYESAGGENWDEQSQKNWCTDRPIREWKGVSVRMKNGEPRVVNLIFTTQNLLGTADLSRLTYLEKFEFNSISGEKHLESLNLSGCINLKQFRDVSSNEFTCSIDKLNLSGCTSLEVLNVPAGTRHVDVSSCTSLGEIDSWSKYTIETITASNCTNLLKVNMVGKYEERLPMTSLDLSGCTNLKMIECTHTEMAKLDITGCVNLEYVNLVDNRITPSLDFSQRVNLNNLNCAGNQLSSLILTGCANIESLYCDGNLLTQLDFMDCTKLKTLNCSNNQITTLKGPIGSIMENLKCSNNQLTDLDLSKFTNLKGLDCSYNLLTELDISFLEKVTSAHLVSAEGNKLYAIYFKYGRQRGYPVVTGWGEYDMSLYSTNPARGYQYPERRYRY